MLLYIADEMGRLYLSREVDEDIPDDMKVS